MQKAIVDLVIEHELSTRQTKLLIEELESGTPRTPEDVYRLVEEVDFSKIKAKQKIAKGKSRINSRSQASFEAEEIIEAMRAYLPRIKRRFNDGLWDESDTENALEITLTLTEILAQIGMNGADVVVEGADSNDGTR